MARTENLSEAIRLQSDALVDAAIVRAKSNGYARYTTTIRAAWEEAVACVTEELSGYLFEAETASSGPFANTNYAADPRFARMREVAIRHRANGVTLQLYLGFLKHFREVYLDLIGPAGGDPEIARSRDEVRGFFDLTELSIASDWADATDDVKLRDLQMRNRAVTQEKDRYFSVFESLRDPAFLLDREKRLITGNQAAAEIFVGEAGAGEIAYLSAMRARRAPLEEALKGLDLWNADQPEGKNALWIDTRHGRLCFDARVRQIHDAVENLRLGYVVILHDVTEHRRATDEAQRAQRAMSQFLATMSHEIRTPLHGVLGAAGLLRAAEPDRVEVYCDAIEGAGRHLLQTLNKVLDYSRLEARPPAPTPRVVELRSVLADYAGFAATLARNAGVACRLETSNRLPAWVEIDWEMTQQVLTNLISNAARHSRGDISLAVRRRDRKGRPPVLRFEVADSGPGIPPEVAEALFEPFGAVTPGRGETSGSGLGLAISRRLVTAMGGEIGFRNHRMGATFWFDLPLVPAAPAEPIAPAAHTLAPANSLAGRRCLVVDDDSVSQFVILENLRRLNLVAVEAGSIAMALQSADELAFDIFILDYHLPDGDGIDLLAELRRRGKVRQGARCISLTANAELISGGAGGDPAPFDAVVPKPADTESLLKALTGERRQAGATAPRIDMDGLSPSVVHAMVEAFESQWHGDYAAFLRALDDRDPAAAAKIAHRLASSCATLGLIDIADVLKAFEAGCRSRAPISDFGPWRDRLLPLLSTAPARAAAVSQAQVS
jgi:two-component system aerobic respiration control sensor histidine kinase ArcB